MTSNSAMSRSRCNAADPEVPNWAEMPLAETWADRIRLADPRGLASFVRAVLGAPRKVRVDMEPGLLAAIPRYALQEFHNLPNGNYSNRISRGYITGFDISMLGQVRKVRRELAGRLAHCHSVLDLGTCGGTLAAEIRAAGVPDVWGADISPYLLKHAATDHPEVRFIQAPAEDLPFADQRFDAIGVCFLFHEMPPRYIAQALAECHRLLKPGGQLLVVEPSRKQLERIRLRSLLTWTGWRHVYFKWLANFVHEPFLQAWHKLHKPALFTEAGFILQEQRDTMPVALYALKKPSACH